MTTPVKLLIVDDHKVFAQGLEAIFRAEPDFAPLAAVTDPDRVLDIAASRQPDVVIMDVLLGEVSGIDLTAQLVALPGPPAVVVLTAYADAMTAIGAIHAGATGFVPKTRRPSMLSARPARQCRAARGFLRACWPGCSSRRAASARGHRARCSTGSRNESSKCSR